MIVTVIIWKSLLYSQVCLMRVESANGNANNCNCKGCRYETGEVMDHGTPTNDLGLGFALHLGYMVMERREDLERWPTWERMLSVLRHALSMSIMARIILQTLTCIFLAGPWLNRIWSQRNLMTGPTVCSRGKSWRCPVGSVGIS